MQYKYSYGYEEDKYEYPKMKTDRNMWKLMILSILTLGIYPMFFFQSLSYDLDRVDPKRERDKTMNFLFVYIVSYFTLSIVLQFWHFHIAGRVEEALERRKIDYDFSTGDYWKWCLFGSLIIIGPFVYLHKLCTAMNLLCESYNEKPVIE